MRIPVAVLFYCLVCGLASAEDKPLPENNNSGNWTGKTVIAIRPQNEIQFGVRVEGKVVAMQPSELMFAPVLEDRDGFLRLKDTLVEGWVRKADYLPQEEATAYWARMYDANPKNPWALFMRGMTKPISKETERTALADVTEAIRLDSANKTFLVYRGVHWLKNGKYDNAITDLTVAIRLDPNDAFNFGKRGAANTMKNETLKGIADFTEAIRLNPKYVNAYVGRGGAWIFEDDYDKAIADFNEAIRLDPTNAVAYENRGSAWLFQSQFENALKDYTEALRLDSKQAHMYSNRSSVWLAIKKYDEAMADIEAALKIDPRDGMALSNKAISHAQTRRFTEAHMAFSEAVGYAPSAETFDNAAWFYSTCPKEIFRDGKKALEYLAKAKELNAKGISYWKPLAAAYAETGQFELAVAEQTKVIEKLKSAKKPDVDEVKKADAILEMYKSKKPYRDVNE